MIESAMLPRFLVKRIKQKPECCVNLPPGSAIEMTTKGSMMTQTFVTDRQLLQLL